MSKTIDERVVSMQFDNRQFEANVKTSMGTLERLKQSLNFKGMSKGLEDVNAAAKSCNFAPMSNAVESVRLKFSALEVMAVTALTNITNSAVNAGKRIASALTIEPVKTGFSEYETQINAVQTILANTQSKGTTLDDVNKALDTLNTYADKTIYNFTEMTRNIGTFTAAGIDLDTSVNAIQGIANLAAVSGSNAQQASTAMYQLSQALASGTVKLMDWNSVVNAGMGGQVFQDALKETARAHGVAVDKMIEKNGSFRESLSEGWITSEILTETLQKFTLTTEGLTDAQIEANRQMLKGKGYTDEQIDKIFELGETATNAATKVKTFTQLWDTLKEAAQSGWTQTWELLVGDFEEAKELWTKVSDTIGGIIGERANNRNEVLKGALTSKWDQMIEKINLAGVSTEEFNEQGRKTLERWGFDVDELIKKHGSLENVFRSGKISSKILEEALDELCDTAVDLSEVEVGLKFGDKGEDVKALQARLKALGYDLGEFGEGGVDGIIGSVTESAIKAFQEANGLEVTGIFDEETIAAMEKASGTLAEIRAEIDGLIGEIDELGGRELLIESFANIWKAITKPLKAIKDAWNAVFGEMFSNENKAQWLYNLIDGFHKFTEKLIISDDAAETIKKTFTGLFEGLKGGFHLIKDGIRIVKDWIMSLWELPFVQDGIAKLGDAFSGVFDTVKKILGPFGKIGKTIVSVDSVTGETTKRIYSLADAFKEVKDRIVAFFSSFSEDESGMSSSGGGVIGIFGRIVEFFKNFKTNIGKYFGEAGVTFENIKTKIVDFVTVVKEKLGDKMGSILALGSLLTFVFLAKKIKDAVTVLAKPFAAVGDFLDTVGGAFKNFTKSLSKKAKAESIKAIAIAIGVLAASVAVLALLPVGKVWSSVGAIVVLAATLTTVALILGKMPVGDFKNFGTLTVALLGIAGALVVFALAAKMMENVSGDGIFKCIVVLSAFMLMVMIMSQMKTSTYLFAEFGKMMLQLSFGLLVLSVAVKAFGNMDTATLIKGGLAVLVFLGAMVGMMAATKFLGSSLPKFGTTMLALTAGLLLLALVVKIFGSMDTGTLIKGGLAVLAFLGIMVGMMAATKLLNKDMPKFGATMLGLSTGLIFMAGAIAILGNMDNAILVKGGIAILGLMGIMVGMMAATKLMGKYSFNAAKMGVMLLAFSGAVLILAGTIALLSYITPADIAKSLVAIAGIGLILAGLIAVTKFAKNVKTGTLIGLSVSVAILAAAIAALSFIDEKDLRNATVALGGVMAVLALLLASTKFVNNKALIGIAGLTLVIGGLAFVLGYLIDKTEDSDKALKVAGAISVLIASLSASAAMLGVAGKFGAAAFVGVGVLAAMLLVLTGFAAIAIWQLPNIAKQLSSFMKELEPFITGVSGIKNSVLYGIKTLAEAILVFTSAAGKYALMDVITFGGMSRAFSSFGKFIKEIVPVVKELAIDISNENLNIDVTSLGAIINAIVGLAEAANRVPSDVFAGAITKFGAAGYYKTTDLAEFTTWVKETIPVIKDLAIDISGKDVNFKIDRLMAIINAVTGLAEAADKAPSTNIGLAFTKFGVGAYINATDLEGFASFINEASDAMSDFASDIADIDLSTKDTDNITAICEAVGLLAEAADKAPSTDIAAAFGKFGSGAGAGAYISIPQLKAFKEWIGGVLPIMSGFSLQVVAADITEADANALSTICKAVEYLGSAAGNAPGIAVAGGLSVFPGGAAIGGYVSIPDLTAFKEWIEQVAPIMSGFAVSVQDSDITEADANALSTICQAVSYLGEAAGKAPSLDIAAGFGWIGSAIVAGTYVSIPDLTAFKEWIEEVVPVMSGFVVDGKEANIKESDANALSTICQAVGYLGEAAGKAPGVDVAAGFAAVGPVIAAGTYVSVTDLTAFKEWIEEVVPVMSGFAIDISETGISATNASTLSSICQAVGYLGEAAMNAPSEEEAAALTLIGAATYVKSTDLDAFTSWIESVVPVLSNFAIDVKDVGITNEDAVTLSKVCNAATILADAAKSVPMKETYSGVFGDWVSSSEFEEFGTWVEKIVDVLSKVASKLAKNKEPLDLNTLTALASSAKVLGETVQLIAVTYWSYGNFDIDKYSNTVDGIADVIIGYGSKVANIDVASVTASSTAAKNLAELLVALAGFDYSKVDIPSFSSHLGQIASAVSSFSTSLEGVDVTHAASQVTSLTNMFNGIAGITFGNVSAFGESLTSLGNTGVDKFVAAFDDAIDRIKAAGSKMITNFLTGANEKTENVTKSFKAIADSAVTAIRDKWQRFYNAGEYVMSGFASGITANGYKATDAAEDIADSVEATIRAALKINSPSKVMIPIGGGIPEGLALGMDKLGGMVKDSAVSVAKNAIDGTKNAISRIADVVNSDIDAQPTIRPVLDLSEVTAGAGAINGMFGMTPSVGVMAKLGSISSSMNDRQNGTNADVIAAISKLGKQIGGMHGDTYTINGVTYDDGSNVSEAVKSLVRAAKVERRR